jgi:leucyl-tRNA synthetase
MELLNLLQRYGRGVADAPAPLATVWNEALDSLLALLAPLAPHVTAELWEQRHPGEPSVHLTSWPTADPELVRQDTVTMVVQVNGKVRDRIEVDAGISESDAEQLALASAKVSEALKEATPKRVVSRPPRLVNVVV